MEVSPPTPAISDVSSSIPALSGNSEVPSKAKGKAKELDKPLPGKLYSPFHSVHLTNSLHSRTSYI